MPNLSQHNQDRQHVLDSTDIVDLIGEHLTLTPKGREFVGVCPFHDDHKPSMWVVPHKQIYHCFSCGAGGNAFDFMMNYHKMGFVDALKALADRAGITLTPFTPRRPGTPTDATLIDGQPDAESQFTAGELAAANTAALDFFRVILRHPEHGTTARDILASRGIPDDMAERFMIGAAPDRWDGLRLTLSKKGYSDELLHAAGLIIPKQDQSGYYDGFRNRLMFPIHDQIGRVVAFGGRRIKPDDEPKYRNSPETALFDKSATLYGLHQARRAVIDNRVMIVTEGYTDVIACHQAGIENVVATLGTALTARHARVLKRMCDTVILLFDGDEAGQRAADRALEVFFAEPIDVKIAVLPDNLDPDELLKQEDGRARFDAAIAGALDALAYHGRRLRDKIQAIESTSGRTQLVERELERLVELGLNRVTPLRRGVILRDLASILGVEEPAVLAQARRFESRRVRRRAVVDATETTENRLDDADSAQEMRDSPEAQILGCILVDPALFRGKSLDPGLFVNAAHRELAIRLAGAQTDEIDHLLTRLEDPGVRTAAVHAYARVKRITEQDRGRLQTTFDECLATLTTRQNRSARDGDAVTVLERLTLAKETSTDPIALARTTH